MKFLVEFPPLFLVRGAAETVAKTWSKAFVSLRLTDTVRMEFSQAALECKRRDLCGVGDFYGIRCLWEGGYFF